jgi:hypothetical protein
MAAHTHPHRQRTQHSIRTQQPLQLLGESQGGRLLLRGTRQCSRLLLLLFLLLLRHPLPHLPTLRQNFCLLLLLLVFILFSRITNLLTSLLMDTSFRNRGSCCCFFPTYSLLTPVLLRLLLMRPQFLIFLFLIAAVLTIRPLSLPDLRSLLPLIAAAAPLASTLLLIPILVLLQWLCSR